MRYENSDPCSRMQLGLAIISACEERGMIPLYPDTVKEQVYRLDCGNNRVVLVYTTVVTMSAREVGTDSIKVCAVYRNSDMKDCGIGKAKHRVHRVGQVEDIVKRMLQRIDQVAETIATSECCTDCGAPKGLSKAGNLYCLEICWKPKAARNQAPPRRVNYGRRTWWRGRPR